MFSKKILFRIIINSIIGGVLVFVWLQFVDIYEIIAVLSQVNIWYLVPIFFFLFVSPAVRAYRLQILLQKTAKISVKDLIFLNGISVLFNFFIPIRGGEIAKGIYLNQTYNLPIAKSLAWIFLDRFIDFAAVLLIAALLLFLLPHNLPTTFPLILLVIATGIIFVAVLMTVKTDIAKILFNFCSHLLLFGFMKQSFEKLYEFFLEILSILRLSVKNWCIVIIMTILGYAADGFVLFFGFQAVGEYQPYLKMYAAQLLAALTYLIPAAPGYVGSAEASGLLVYSGVFGINSLMASAAVVLIHLATLVFIVCYGVISIYGLKINLALTFKKVLKRE